MLVAELGHLHDVFFWKDTAGCIHNFRPLITEEMQTLFQDELLDFQELLHLLDSEFPLHVWVSPENSRACTWDV